MEGGAMIGKFVDDADLGRDRRPARRMLGFMIPDHPHRAGAHLRRELVCRLARQSPILSGVVASDTPGAVQHDASSGS